MDQVKQVAERIKELREVTGKSQEEMAKATGKSLADYQKAEEGEKDFSFTFLFKCASAFGIDVSELVSGESPRLKTYQLVRKGAGEKLPEKSEFQYYNLNFLKRDKIAQPYFVTAKYRPEFENAPINTTSHEGEEFDYVLKGTLKIQIGEYTEVLGEGDSITYDSSREHGMVAMGGDCDFLAVVVPPKGKNADEIVGHPETALAVPAAQKYAYEKKPVYEKFIKVRENDKGGLEKIEFVHKKDFNFAFDVVDYLGETKPHKLAMLWVSKDHEERRFTFRDMKENSARAANYFKSLGIGKGDRVMLVLKRHHQFWSAILGLHKLGAVAIPATNLLTTKDFEYRFNAAGVKALVITSDGNVSDQALAALPASPTVKHVMMACCVSEDRGQGSGVRGQGMKEGFLSYDAGLAASSPVFKKPTGKDGVNADVDPMLMYFTSGTTGYPKIANQPFSYALGHFTTAKYWHHADPDGLHFTISDTGWAKSVWGKLYGQWLCEAAFLTYDFDKFDTKDLLGMFAAHQITTFCAPPTMYRFFIKEDLKSFDLSSLRTATIAGEALNPEVFERFYEGTGLKLMEAYGQTEATMLVGNLVGMEPKPGSMGKPNPQYVVDLLAPGG
ncbi:MAG: AMP-binding protein, partial [Firmicutes bacterium]|nr:AMP-binding protein [Bacillota bacterium]